MLLYIAIIFAIGAAAFWVISDIVASQSYKQQQAISPVFTLVEEELLEPMHIAKTLATARIYDKYFHDQSISDQQIIQDLGKLESQFGLGFYLAKESNRKQYNSDGSSFDLIEGKVGWYFELQKEPQDFLAVLGKREDVHLYIDVKQYDEIGNFIGFVGIAKSLKDFLTSFRNFRQAYGHEFVFTNSRDEIVLSSKEKWLPDGLHLSTVNDLPWFNQFRRKQLANSERSKLIQTDEGELLISQFDIEALDWKLYVITPLSERQSEINKVFIFYVFILFALLFIVYKVVQHFIREYLQTIDNKINYDPLTKLSNRHHLEQQFSLLSEEYQQIGIIIVDIDHFKQVNDTHGHNAGDLVLQMLAKCLNEAIRKQDIAGRWGGDEFVILLPGSDTDNALQIARRCKELLAKERVYLSQSSLEIYASFGVTTAKNMHNLTALLEVADKALYQAKNDGRNRICYLSI